MLKPSASTISPRASRKYRQIVFQNGNVLSSNWWSLCAEIIGMSGEKLA
jgi:hypothetical protein